MSNANDTAGALQSISAVGYLRRSTDKQEASIPEQTKAIQKYADDNKYTIIRWYTDDAISGDDTENRHGFKRMLAEAEDRRDFKFIICWDQSRFGRFSPQEAGHWTYQFSKAGIQLVTTDRGLIDWNDFTGWLTYSVDQHARHQFIINLSRDVVRGQLEAANKGSWLGQPPYGYRIEGERKSKRLVIDEQDKAMVVRRIFCEYVEEGRSMSDIARRLQGDGIASPGENRPWRYDSVRTILDNPAYAGDYVSGRFSYGKYHIAQDGCVTKVVGPRKSVKKPKAKWITRENHHEAIVSRETFAQAQELLAKKKVGRKRFTPETNPFALNGILRCGKCGSPMWGDTVKGRKFYRCGKWQKDGSRACEGTKVNEPILLNDIADSLEQLIGIDGDALGAAAHFGHLHPDIQLPETFEKVKKLVMPSPRPKRDYERLRRKASDLVVKIEKARGNLVLLDPEYIPLAQDKIRGLEKEHSEVERELLKAKPIAERNVNEIVLEVLNQFYGLVYCCRSLMLPDIYDDKGQRGVLHPDGTVTTGGHEMAAPSVVKRFLRHVAHIVCHSEKNGRGTGTRHVFVRGEIVFRGVGVVTTESNLRNRAS